MFENYMTIREVANKFKCTTGNINYLCKNGKLPGAVKVSDLWLIPRESVENYQPALKGFSAMWEKRRRGKKKEAGELSDEEIKDIIKTSANNGGIVDGNQEGGRE